MVTESLDKDLQLEISFPPISNQPAFAEQGP